MTKIGLDVDNILDIDRRWYGRFEFLHFELCNVPILVHRAEKCRHLNGKTYDDALVKRFKNKVNNICGILEKC